MKTKLSIIVLVMTFLAIACKKDISSPSPKSSADSSINIAKKNLIAGDTTSVQVNGVSDSSRVIWSAFPDTGVVIVPVNSAQAMITFRIGGHYTITAKIYGSDSSNFVIQTGSIYVADSSNRTAGDSVYVIPSQPDTLLNPATPIILPGDTNHLNPNTDTLNSTGWMHRQANGSLTALHKRTGTARA